MEEIKKEVSNTPSILFLGFADNKVPEQKEVRSKDWIYFGSDNKFPSHLLYLFDKSSNHNAIVNGKVTYILGGGFESNPVINVMTGEKRNKLFKKAVTDMELSGGYYLQCVWKMGGGADWSHMPFQNIRKAKDKPGYYWSDNWDRKKPGKEDPKYIPPFDPTNKQGAQLFCFKEYRPGAVTYPLPGYFGALNDIETDVEISIYNLSVMKNGQFSGKLISFFNGDVTAEEKRKLEAQWNAKFNGSGNAGKTMLAFNHKEGKPPDVADLSATDLDKLFEQLNKTVQAEIFSGHQITSGMLFGIAEPGKLGGRNEIQDAYEIFKNTYVNSKQMEVEEVADYLAPFMGAPTGEKLQPVAPIGTILNPVDFKEILPREWVFEKLGIHMEDYPDMINPSGVTSSALVNDNLKNLTGRQQQNIERITRKYKQGRITRQLAETLLRSGLGLDDQQIPAFLDFAAVESEDEVADLFETVGEKRDAFTVVKSKPYKFESDAMAFKELRGVDSAIVDLIRKDKRITAEVIAATIKEDTSYVKTRIKSLTEAGILTTSTQTIGTDTIIEHAVNSENIDIREPSGTADIFIRYTYEPKPGLDPIIETTRPFCRRLIELDKMYSRAEIEMISQRVGYSVFDRKGGWWGDKPECRHRWVSNIVIKKRK